MNEYSSIKILAFYASMSNTVFQDKLHLLRMYGFNIYESDSDNGLAAKVIKHKYDLLLIDLHGQGSTAWDLIKEIRLNPQISYIPILTIGEYGEEYELLALQKGVNYHLGKTERITNLITKISFSVSYSQSLIGSKGIFEKIKEVETNEVDAFLQMLKKAIYGNGLDQPIDYEYIASQVGYSRSTINRKVQQYIGVNLSTLILMIKINFALKMLKASNTQVEQISVSLGFKSTSYFTTMFKKYIGLTPRQYRKTGVIRGPKLFYKIQSL